MFLFIGDFNFQMYMWQKSGVTKLKNSQARGDVDL